MSKQDRQSARTVTDIERRYNFGQTFAEVYGLINDVQKGTDAAIDALDKSLDAEGVFNRLTDYGTVQGIYRENNQVYINASYIKSGQISADLIDVDNLTVNAANITGSITFNMLSSDLQSTINAAGVPGYIKSTYIDSTTIKSPTIEAGTLSAPIITGGEIWGSVFYGNAFNMIGTIWPLGEQNFFCLYGGDFDGNYAAKFYSPGGVGAIWDFWKTEFYGQVDFSNATVSGINLTSGSGEDIVLSANNGAIAVRLDASDDKITIWVGGVVWVMDATGLHEL